MYRINRLFTQYCFVNPVNGIYDDKIYNNSSQKASHTEKSEKEIYCECQSSQKKVSVKDSF